MSIVVYQDVATPIIPSGDLAGPVRDALGDSLRSMRYVTPDFAGLYQDAAGTTPVTAVGQPVGLMMDRRFGLGEDHWPVSGWERRTGDGVVVAEGNTYTVTGATSQTDIRPAVGRTMRPGLTVVEASYTPTSGSGTVLLYAAGVPTAFPAGGGRILAIGPSTNSGLEAIRVPAGLNGVFTLHDYYEVPGNHASQTTTTARPTLRSGPLRIDYDGVDDYLRTVFPALGSDVTIARSIHGVGAQILTGQTIAAGNWDDNVDSCATLVIDRALTGPETALVTAFLNQQAGV